MMEIILATKNKHKTKEIAAVLGSSVQLQDLTTIGFEKEIVENGSSFSENALIKCQTIYEATHRPVLADDSGLCVAALGGEPGIYSARFGGEKLTDVERYELLLEKMKGRADRDAAFVCALALYLSPSRFFLVQEACHGLILESPCGTGGFGYDPIFFFPFYGRSLAQLTKEEKNAVSHRGKAVRAMKMWIENIEL